MEGSNSKDDANAWMEGHLATLGGSARSRPVRGSVRGAIRRPIAIRWSVYNGSLSDGRLSSQAVSRGLGKSVINCANGRVKQKKGKSSRTAGSPDDARQGLGYLRTCQPPIAGAPCTVKVSWPAFLQAKI